MKRQEFLLNLTLVVVIGALVYFIYEGRENPGMLTGEDDSAVPTAPKTKKGDKAPATETSYETADASSDRKGKFGETNLFRALLTPTPTPTPTPPPPPPTPDIGKALGGWKLLSVYEGKAMIEDTVKSKDPEAEGAIFELKPGETKQVDVGQGIMKTATLKKLDDANPYNPEIVLGLEGTEAEKKVNLDTVPTDSGPAKPGQPGQPPPGQPPPPPPAAAK